MGPPPCALHTPQRAQIRGSWQPCGVQSVAVFPTAQMLISIFSNKVLFKKVFCFERWKQLSFIGALPGLLQSSSPAWVAAAQFLEPSLLPPRVCICGKLDPGAGDGYATQAL